MVVGFASKSETGMHEANGMKDLFPSLAKQGEHKAMGVSPGGCGFQGNPRERAKDSRNKGLSTVCFVNRKMSMLQALRLLRQSLAPGL